jgi:hypothetical protein
MSLTKVSSAVLNVDDLYGFRNRIINGDMRIAQRGTGAVTSSGSFPVDRFIVQNITDGAFSAQQDSSVPAGFVNSLKLSITTADTSLAATQNLVVFQLIEGFNVADLGWGTANAQPITVSFFSRSSLTGTFGGSVRNGAANRSYPFTYTISSADTWEYKTIHIPGDTSGTWATNNSVGLGLFFGLGVGTDRSGTAGSWAGSNFLSATGAVSVVGTSGATFYITGVQLEKGTVATPFERRPFGTELALCQRYYYRMRGSLMGFVKTSTTIECPILFPVALRAAPTALEQSGTASDYLVAFTSVASTCTAVPIFLSANIYVARTEFTVGSGLTPGQAGTGSTNTVNGNLSWSAEL